MDKNATRGPVRLFNPAAACEAFRLSMKYFLRLLAFMACLTLVARGDVAVPPNVLDPPTAPEAWNVIGLAMANVARLLNEDRLAEIQVQISLCSPALRRLAEVNDPPERGAELKAQSVRGLGLINSIAIASAGKDHPALTQAFDGLRSVIQIMAAQFDAKIVATEISLCSMHPECVAPNATTPCEKCGMAMVKRRIPYSFLYIPPGEPTMILTASAGGPLQAGTRADVKVQIKRRDGSPVLIKDLLVMHTQPIHLLIVDPSLTDYHHEHPTPTAIPGEYAFSFTPTKSARYRIWADLVPADRGVQEYLAVELAGAGVAESIGDMSGRFDAVAGGLKFRLSFENGALPRARQVRVMQLEVTDAAGKPVRRLEPVMNAFCHLVGFYEDYRTVVHLHPEGGDILRDDLRGGPVMGFKFYPPRAGFIRLFCQVVVDGKTIFAPFNVNVAP